MNKALQMQLDELQSSSKQKQQKKMFNMNDIIPKGYANIDAYLPYLKICGIKIIEDLHHLNKNILVNILKFNENDALQLVRGINKIIKNTNI